MVQAIFKRHCVHLHVFICCFEQSRISMLLWQLQLCKANMSINLLVKYVWCYDETWIGWSSPAIDYWYETNCIIRSREATQKLIFFFCSGMLQTELSRPNIMKWQERKKSSICSCTLAGAPETITPVTRKRNVRKRMVPLTKVLFKPQVF